MSTTTNVTEKSDTTLSTFAQMVLQNIKVVLIQVVPFVMSTTLESQEHNAFLIHIGDRTTVSACFFIAYSQMLDVIGFAGCSGSGASEWRASYTLFAFITIIFSMIVW